MEHTRKAMVAGSFYDADKESLSKQLKECFLHEIGPQKLPENTQKERKIIGIISPHAGFIFSGPIAAHNFLSLSYQKAPDTVILFGPNHRGLGEAVSLMSSGFWETPLGSIEIDKKLAKNIIDNDKENIIQEDTQAHLLEHSIEVQLPFLQFIYSKSQFRIVPISITNQQLPTMEKLANTIFTATQDSSCLFIASSDFTHYEIQESARRKDYEAIEQIVNMNSRLFYQTIKRNEASICGPGPIAVVIEICKKYGIKRGELLKYATSGDVSEMNEQVVGYASIIFKQ